METSRRAAVSAVVKTSSAYHIIRVRRSPRMARFISGAVAGAVQVRDVRLHHSLTIKAQMSR